MTNEEMQSTIQFLLEQQAQFASRVQKDEDRLARLENAFVTLTEVVRSADERMDTFDTHLNTLSGKMSDLAEAQVHTEQRLNALIDVVERYISGQNGKSQA